MPIIALLLYKISTKLFQLQIQVYCILKHLFNVQIEGTYLKVHYQIINSLTTSVAKVVHVKPTNQITISTHIIITLNKQDNRGLVNIRPKS